MFECEKPSQESVSLSRRDFSHGLLPTILSFSLIRTLFARDAFAAPGRSDAYAWLKTLHQRSADLKTNDISPREWQDQVEALFGGVDLMELLTLIDFEKLIRGFEFPEDRANTKTVRFPHLRGLPEDLAFFSKIFGLKKGAAIIPHGHTNMVSMHLVIKGELALRHYDRVRDEPGHMIVRPTIDRKARRGDRSSISDERDNVHWLTALSQKAFTFDVIVTSLDPKFSYPYKMEFVDPLLGEPLVGGFLRFKKLEFQEAIRKYGRHIHHGEIHTTEETS